MNQIVFDKAQQNRIGAFARRVHYRMSSAGARGASYLDIFQELCIAWCKARDAWKAEFQVPFEAYAMKGMRMHINRWAQSDIDFSHLTPVALDHGVGEDNGELHEVIAIASDSPAETVQVKDTRDYVLARLSRRARLFIELLDNPPQFLVDTVKAGKAKAESAKARGISVIVPNSVTAAMVFGFMEAKPTERTAIRQELDRMAARMQKRGG